MKWTEHPNAELAWKESSAMNDQSEIQESLAGRPGRARAHSSRRGDRGAALVEFAIVLPVLLCLTLGMITGGMALSKKINMTDAVREGARFGATIELANPADATQVSAWAADVKQRIVTLSGGDLQTSDICVALTQSTGSAPADSTNCFVADPADSAGQYIVRVRGTGTAKLEAYFFSRTLNIEAKTAARYERAD